MERFFAVFSGIEFMIWLSVKSLEEGNREQGPWVTGTAEASQFAKAEEEPVFALGFDAASQSTGKRKVSVRSAAFFPTARQALSLPHE